jgi:hypothetical protein
MGAGHLLVPAGTMPLRCLTKIQPRFSACFEYKIKNDHVVRIEANYSLPRGSEEFEVNDIRCFKPRSIGGPGEPEMPMQIGMIDFERFVSSCYFVKRTKINSFDLDPTGS